MHILVLNVGSSSLKFQLVDTDEAAIARGVSVPMEPELSQAARSRRAGILLVAGALGFIITFGLIAQIEREPETWVAAAFGIIPLAVGIGYFVDWTLINRDLHPSN